MLALKLIKNTLLTARQNISSTYLPLCLTNIDQNTRDRNGFGYNISRFCHGKNDPNIIADWLDKLDEETQKKVKLIQTELVYKQQTNENVPDLKTLNIEDYENMLNLSTNKRYKHYTYLHKIYHSMENARIKSEIRQALAEQYKQEKLEAAPTSTSENKHIEYGLGKNAFLMKIYPRTIDKWKNHKLLRVMRLDGQKLIYDCGYDDSMNDRETKSAAKQLTFCFSTNRNSRNPYVFHFVNMNYDGRLWYYLKQNIPTIVKKSFPIRVQTESLSELFPKENLVYLTPDSENELRGFNPCDHYIIGGIVDKGPQKPLSLAKAKKLDIRTARLPLERFVKFKSNKNLTLDQITAIMLEIKTSRDWNKAFENIAPRKLL